MLKSHMDAKENALIAISKIPSNSGHSLHKGTPREAFIREFLESHLSENVAIGTGEIIDANSRPGMPRNQFDIVVYKKNYPKLDFGGGINGFLIESVISTIEVKSVLTQIDLEQAINAAICSKTLIPYVISSFHSGFIPPKVLNYVVAYDGPVQMKTVYDWIPKIHSNLGISISSLPQNYEDRIKVSSPSIDGIFILGRGFVYFDNVPVSFAASKNRTAHPDLKWVFADTASGNLLLLFLMLQSATANIEGKWLNPAPYISSFKLSRIQFGLI
jgi:hypothetical protein